MNAHEAHHQLKNMVELLRKDHPVGLNARDLPALLRAMVALEDEMHAEADSRSLPEVDDAWSLGRRTKEKI